MSSLVSVILALRMVSRAVFMSASISSDGTVSSVDASVIPGGHLVQLNCSFFFHQCLLIMSILVAIVPIVL